MKTLSTKQARRLMYSLMCIRDKVYIYEQEYRRETNKQEDISYNDEILNGICECWAGAEQAIEHLDNIIKNVHSKENKAEQM